MKVNYKKIIWSTILFTLSALIVVAMIISMLMYFVFTKDFADFFYSMGSENIAANLYHKVYEKTDDIFYCYKSLNIEIKQEDNKNIIKYYKEFLSDDEYNSFMNSIIKNNESMFVGVLEKSTILNENNYLENQYIKALINTGEDSQALDRAIENFKTFESFNFKEQGVYSFNLFISDTSNFDIFNSTYTGYSDTLINSMQAYFDASNEIYLTNKDTTDKLEKSYFLALGNRLILVGQNINTIYSKLNINSDKIDANMNAMQTINDIIPDYE